MYRLLSCAERVPPTWLAPGLDQGPSSLLPRGTSFGRSVQPRPPYFRRGWRTDLSARGRVPPIPEVPGRVLTPTPLNGYTFTLFCRHPCRHGRPSIRLQKIQVHYCERLVPFPRHNNSSSIQHLGDECRAEPRELQLRSRRSFQRYVVDPYQLSCLVLSSLDLAVVVMFLVQRCPLQPHTSMSVRRPQSPLECGYILTHCAGLLFQGVLHTLPGPEVLSADPTSSCLAHAGPEGPANFVPVGTSSDPRLFLRLTLCDRGTGSLPGTVGTS